MTSPHSVSLDADTYQKITLLARAWSLTPAQAIRRHIEHFNTPTQGTDADHVAVYAIYARVRINGSST
ncbi:hypothetical protein [Streptomyces colonosanans]|uniref:Uncharacterized protein n=1 Tax=Streptomyces colonosanans TaxID=1428652 RepID=A0A1S2P3X1_9ACTN|nr:hypothetical protein [Streptomyces colonosanans]OIJ88388.1 hypothetical protein BIV24_22765 [Streptomyces colonosanans]